MNIFLNLYKLYCNLPDHPAKLRLVRLYEKFFLKPKPLSTFTSFNKEVLIDLQDNVERKVLLSGSYEASTLSFIANNLQRSDVFVGSGTAYGYHLLVGCEKIGEEGLAIGIDPQPGSIMRTFQNLVMNGYRGRFCLVNVALASEEQFFPCSAPNVSNRGSSSLAARKIGDFKDFMSFCTTFDRLMSELNVNKVKMFVLDVEGYENIVVDSFQEVLPEIIVFEVHPHFIKNTGLNPDKLFKSLSDKGYNIHDFFGNQLEKYLESQENNYVACLKGINVQWLDPS